MAYIYIFCLNFFYHYGMLSLYEKFWHKHVISAWNSALFSLELHQFGLKNILLPLSTDNKISTYTGDISRRVCTAAEIKFYFNSFFERGPSVSNYLKPNKNCNLTSWVSGCEPGWGCTVAEGDKVEIKDSKNIPLRIEDCQPCCEGFFCPQGITCMIRKYMTIPMRYLPEHMEYRYCCNKAERKSKNR